MTVHWVLGTEASLGRFKSKQERNWILQVYTTLLGSLL